MKNSRAIRESQRKNHTALFEIFDISDDGTNERNGKDSEGFQLNGEAIQRSKLRVDTRKWALSKLVPKKYGDRLH